MRGVRRVCGVAALLCALALVAQADLEIDKRSELSAVPFVMGSRYGRSPAAAAPRLLTPRNDRFFMGSRYGKRSPLSPPSPTQYGHPPADPAVPPAALVCEFTGVAPLYRCERRARTLLPYYNRNSEEDPAGSDGGEEE